MLEHLSEGLLILVIGMGGVFASLLLLAGMIRLFKAADEVLNNRRIKRYTEKVEHRAVDPEFNDETVAVITAAVESTVRRPVSVRAMRFLGSQTSGSWSVTGRVNIMASHSIKKR